MHGRRTAADDITDEALIQWLRAGDAERRCAALETELQRALSARDAEHAALEASVREADALRIDRDSLAERLATFRRFHDADVLPFPADTTGSTVPRGRRHKTLRTRLSLESQRLARQARSLLSG